MKVRTLILVLTAAVAVSAQTGDPGVTLERAIRKETVEGDLKGAIDLYKKAIAGAAKNRAAAAKALLRLGECYEKQGDAEAQRTYERLVREFSDQTEQAREARARLAAGGSKSVVAQLIAKGSSLGLRSRLIGRVTPDGRLCAFIDQQTRDVAVRDLRTGEVRRVTNGGMQIADLGAQLVSKEGAQAPRGTGEAMNPVPSRDGKQIAYNWWGTPSEVELRVINVDGSGMRTVPLKRKTGDYFQVMDWSPDGKTILVSGYDRVPGWNGMATVDAGTGAMRQLPNNKLLNAPREVGGISPDGRWVLYSRPPRWGDSDWDIFAIDMQSGQETPVVTGAGADRMPMWVPDSDKILFRSDRAGKNGIWMVRFQGGQATGAPVLLKPDSGDYEPKGVSRDGSLFYTLWHESTDVYQATVDSQTLRVQGTPARLVDTHLGRNDNPSWSPGGDSFAYYSWGDATRLVVRQPDGKETVAAEPIRSTGFAPHWCSTGDRLLSWGTPSAFRLRFFDARTGAASPPELQVKGVRPPWQLAVSPDCRSAYVSTYSYTSKRRRIYRYDFATGKETDLLEDAGEWAMGLRVSPDGRWLALSGKLEDGKESGILLLSTAGGALRMLVPGDWGYSWSPDSKRVVYARRVGISQSGPVNEVYWVPVEGGAPQPTGIRMPGAAFPSLNADGKRLLFSASEGVPEFWVLRNLPLN